VALIVSILRSVTEVVASNGGSTSNTERLAKNARNRANNFALSFNISGFALGCQVSMLLPLCNLLQRSVLDATLVFARSSIYLDHFSLI
jgi:hypothetical protein